VSDPGDSGHIRAEMRLRPSRPPVTRLSRKVLLGLGIVAAAGIAAALFVALEPQRQTTGSELYNTSNRSTPEGLNSLPRDYTGLPKNVPRLGPPLPGDLGPPIANAGAPAPVMAANAGQQEEEAALKSRLFVTTNFEQPPGVAMLAASQLASAVAPANGAAASPTSKDHNLAFLYGAVNGRMVSSDRVEAPASRYVLQAGSVIPVALITGIRSDLPGEVTAQVTEDVHDSPTGRILLIPQGARLVGQYDAQVSFGQSRVLLVWTRLIMPNGRSIVLERQPAADAAGYAGLEDAVDNHWGMLFKAAILSTLLSVGSEAGVSGNSSGSLAAAIQQGMSQSFNQVGEQVVGRSLAIQPTLTIRPGFPVRVMVTRDLVLEPYSR
jgi:type IV secretion system protein VirB10